MSTSEIAESRAPDVPGRVAAGAARRRALASADSACPNAATLQADDGRADAPEWAPPERFDGLQVLRPLGVGGMGSVYLAREEALDRLVAVKFLAGGQVDDERRRRFIEEAKALARVSHPNVSGIYRIGAIGGAPYLCYEYVDGLSLDRVAAPLPWTRVFSLALALSRGLAATHRRGVVHRDIKPANIIVDAATGEPKIIDFGIAVLGGLGTIGAHPCAAARASKRTASGEASIVGTPRYIAPEQWTGAPSSVKTDLYSLGLVLYELCAGASAEVSSSACLEEWLMQLHERSVPSLRGRCPECPEGFAAVIERCLRVEPGERFRGADELVHALEQLELTYRALRLLPSAAERGGMLADEVALVQASFRRIAARVDEFTSSFYRELFARAPKLRPLFPADLRGQRSKLADALGLAVQSLGHQLGLQALLEELGERHAGYGVEERHFELVRVTLLSTLARFEGSWWSRATAGAWCKAYDEIASAMIRGLRRGLSAPARAS